MPGGRGADDERSVISERVGARLRKARQAFNPPVDSHRCTVSARVWLYSAECGCGFKTRSSSLLVGNPIGGRIEHNFEEANGSRTVVHLVLPSEATTPNR
jgi:hypothetical protein